MKLVSVDRQKDDSVELSEKGQMNGAHVERVAEGVKARGNCSFYFLSETVHSSLYIWFLIEILECLSCFFWLFHSEQFDWTLGKVHTKQESLHS